MSDVKSRRLAQAGLSALSAVTATIVCLSLTRRLIAPSTLSTPWMTSSVTYLTAPTAQDDWIIDMHRFSSFYPEKSYYKSQGSQDEYFDRIFAKIGTTNRYFVEFGFNERSYTSGRSGANTWNLYDQGWRGLLLDAKFENPDINLHAHYLFGNNIADIFLKYSVPKEFDLLSCDMDSHDLFVFAGILEAGYRPRVITTEYNCNYPLSFNITQLDPSLISAEAVAKHKFRYFGCATGASAGALRSVAAKYGYQLVGVVEGLDLVWMRVDLIRPEWAAPSFEWFFKEHCEHNINFGTPKLRDVLDTLIDYDVYVRQGDIKLAQKAAEGQILSADLKCFNKIQSRHKEK